MTENGDASVRRPNFRGGWRFSLSAKLMAAIALLILLPAGAFLAHLYSSNRAAAMTAELQRIRDYSREVATEIDSFIAAQQHLTGYAAVSTELRDYLEHAEARGEVAGFSAWLSNWKGISDDIDEVFVLDRTGTCLAASNPEFVGQSYRFRPYFQAAIAGKNHVSDWSIGITSGKPGIYLSSPIPRNGAIGGVLVIKLNPAPVDRIIRRSFGLGLQAFVTNGAGVVLAHYDPAIRYATVDDLTAEERAAIAETHQFAGIEQPSLKLTALRADIAHVRPGETLTSAVYRFRGDSKIAALTGTQSLHWVAGVTAPFSVIEAPAQQLLMSFVPMVAVILVFAALSSFYVSRYLTAPLQNLLAAVTRFGEGEANVRASTAGYDEVGRLAAAFNDMAGRIAKHTQELEDRVAERTRALSEAYDRIKCLSITDPLTGCFNRRHMDEHLGEELARAQRYRLDLSILMCDVDFFKRVNDTYGHQAGDRVLTTVGALLRGGLRQKIDWIVRYGGEEFLLVLPGTSEDNAATLAERLRQTIEAATVEHDGKGVRLTASFGLTALRHDRPDTADTVLARADGALYRAKESGRNRVVMAGGY